MKSPKNEPSTERPINHHPTTEGLGRCLRRCGQIARYVEVDERSELWLVACPNPKCDFYPATHSEMDDVDLS